MARDPRRILIAQSRLRFLLKPMKQPSRSEKYFEAPREKGSSEWRTFGAYREKLVMRALPREPLVPHRPATPGRPADTFNLYILRRLYGSR